MASLEARYLASVVLDSREDGTTDLGILSRALLHLFGVGEAARISTDDLATEVQARFPEGEVPTWFE